MVWSVSFNFSDKLHSELIVTDGDGYLWTWSFLSFRQRRRASKDTDRSWNRKKKQDPKKEVLTTSFHRDLDVAFCAPSRKSSFLRVLHSCEGGRRLALLQGDSRVGRARIRKILALAERELSTLDGTFALLDAQQIKMVSREACVCAMCSRTGQGLHVCMRAYLRNLCGKCCTLWHCICSIFLFVVCKSTL